MAPKMATLLRGAKRLLKKKGRRKEKSGRVKRKCHLFGESGGEVEKELVEKEKSARKKKVKQKHREKRPKVGQRPRDTRELAQPQIARG